jgi:hypothetical protein
VAADTAEEAGRAGLSQKLQDLLESATKARWNLVKDIIVSCRKGSDNKILLILRKVCQYTVILSCLEMQTVNAVKWFHFEAGYASS